MNCRSEKYTREKYWNDIMDCMDGILMISCVVLHEHFGFGEKRIKEFLDEYNEVNCRFAEWAQDDVWEQKTECYRHVEQRKAYRRAIEQSLRMCLPPDVVEDWFNNRDFTFKQYNREINKKRKDIERSNRVSMAEAAEMQNKMQAFRQFMENEEVKL